MSSVIAARRLAFLGAAFVAASLATAGNTIIPLWPEGVPGLKASPPAEVVTAAGNISHVVEPTLEMIAPAGDRANGTAVIVCPGGGYMNVVYQREGVQYGNWLGTLGVTTFILKYRLVDYGHPAPLQDVLRAIRLVRSRAKEFGIDPARIGVIGSSAGGHLAATAGTLFDHPAGKTGAALDQTSARPDFLILLYAVISMTSPASHAGSRTALLGQTPTDELASLLSAEKQVIANTPPTLLIHTQADQVVPVENSLLFYSALTRAGVPAEMYLFEKGGHGVSLKPGLGTTSGWPQRAEEWLRTRGLLDPRKS